MKYKNKRTGTIVEPSDELTAQTFKRSDDWTELINEKPLNKMTTAELEAKALELELDISECKTNPERVAKLMEAIKEGEE